MNMAQLLNNIPWYAWPLFFIFVIQVAIITLGLLLPGKHYHDTDNMADKFLR